VDEPSEVRATPARRQYLDVKAQCPPDTILLYRIGDFYETFDDDAHRVAEALHITLTSREFGRGVRIPLAGIPHHALNSYLGRLLSRGFKVAIAEQLSEPGHGIVDRAVVRVITPGTISEPELLRASENSYLAAVARSGDTLALAYVDVSTGEFAAAQFEGADAQAALDAELARLAPAETLMPPGVALPHRGALTVLEDRLFEPATAAERLLKCLHVRSLEAFGCKNAPAVIAAAGAIAAYLERTNPDLLHLLSGFSTYTTNRFLVLDPQTRGHLDLVRGGRGGSSRGGLLAILDRTRTAMGSRLLRRRLGQPLLDVAEIDARLDALAALVADAQRRRRLEAALAGMADVERLTARVCQGKATARDCDSLATVLARVPALQDELRPLAALDRLANDLDPVAEAVNLVQSAVSTEEGRLVKRGHDSRLDQLLHASEGAERALLALESRERERTGIRSLKVGFTRVFGYYIEVSRPNLKLVPTGYRHKQTLANAERYTTPELRDCEEALLHAEERAAALERDLFEAVLVRLAAWSMRLLATGSALAELDLLLALAEVAVTRGYVRPVLDGTCVLEISGGRHPVVEAGLSAGEFIANDCALDADGMQIALVTGPNMAGKSTYLRQIALCTVLAQMGSFVPAAAARIGVVDRIFTRIGAQDDIAAGASTFMVEMIETAAILRHATQRSLVLLDEVGRGTGTQDGMAIAQATVEYLHHYVGARTLFATHFHELTALSESLPRLRTFNVSAVEDAGRLVFLHRVLPGASDRSYGVQVARLAGIPPLVAARAEELLRQATGGRSRTERAAVAFDAQDLVADLAALDVNRLSPMEAMARLFDLQQRAARQMEPERSSDASEGRQLPALPAALGG
jgi:DNA mismatch repair protein MutS